MSINDRIKQLRKTLKLSQTDFGKNLGVSRDVINNLDRSAVEPKPLILEHICSVYNVNPDWLMHGNGEMFNERDSIDEISDFLSSIMDDDDTSIRRRLVLALSKFDGDDWATVEKFLDSFTKTEKDGE